MRRASDGTYLSIAGLVESQGQQGQQGQQGKQRVRGLLVAAAAAVCLVGLTRAALRR